jgi:aspartate/methionine/tyrosine aminotransferase
MAEFELEHYFDRYEFTTPYMLSSSDAETLRLDELLALADDETANVWRGLGLGYTPVAGSPFLREAIAELYERVGADDVVVFAGGQEPIFATMNVCLGPGDHAVVVTPAYQSLYEVGRALGAEVDLVRLDEAGGWALDVDALRERIRPETRLIVLNLPNSPTGALIGRDQLRAVFEAADEVGARVFVDEVYRFLERDPRDRLPAAADLAEHGISLGVMSKSFGLAGLRIGWVATRDAELRRRLISLKHYLTICNAAPSEVLATIALRARGALLDRTRTICERNLELLDAFFERHRGIFRWVRPPAGTIGFAELLAAVAIEDFARELIENEGVMLLPGSVFDWPGNHFRLGYGRANMPEALERLERFAAGRL